MAAVRHRNAIPREHPRHVAVEVADRSGPEPAPDTPPIDVRTACLIVLTVLLTAGALEFARALFVPVIIGVLVSYVLEPAVATLMAAGMRRAVAATIVFVLAVCSVAGGAFALRHQAAALINRLPNAAQQLRVAIEARTSGQPGPVSQVQRAANELRQLSDDAALGDAAATRRDTDADTQQKRPAGPPVALDHQPFELSEYLWTSSMTVTGFVGDVIVVSFLAYYLLLAGDLFRRRLVEIAGPTLSRKKITLQILDNISVQIGRYLFIRSLISVIVGVGTGAAFWALGVSQPAVWGVVAGALNIVPYVGPALVMVAAALAAFVQFQTLTMAAVTATAAVAVACAEAYVITPWLTSEAAGMNPAAVFVGLVFWGWLWGVPGLVLAIPLLMVLKSISDHVEALQPVAALLRK